MWNFNRYPNKICAITEDGEEFTYSSLSAFCDEMKQYLPPRTLVFCLCTNAYGSMAGYVSFLKNKVVPLMLDAHIDTELLDNFLRLYRPQYIWAPSQTAERFGTEPVFEAYGYSLVSLHEDAPFPLNDDLALLLTTSGSTGSPKLVRQSYKNIEANTASIVEYLNIDDTERAVTTLPMNYTYGLSVINSHLEAGATVILTSKTLMQREFWEQFERFGATSFGGVPYTYEILDKLRFFRRDVPTLRTMTQAGGKLSPELHKKFAEYAAQTERKFIVMYGQTEATARMGWLPAEKSLEKAGSMGIAIPGGKFSLIDAEGNEITTPDTVGELVYEGDNVTLGYAETGEDLTKGDERGGKLVTGDMAKFDADGFYYIVGRKKRFLKIFGNRVNLDETERLIKAHFNGLDCACAGRDDRMDIFVTNEEVLKDVKAFIAEKSRLNPTAFRVAYLEKIPKNEAGKTLYASLEDIDE